jgi:hypothetical protein
VFGGREVGVEAVGLVETDLHFKIILNIIGLIYIAISEIINPMSQLILVVVTLVVISVVGREAGGKEGTRVTFFVEHEVDPEKDYL